MSEYGYPSVICHFRYCEQERNRSKNRRLERTLAQIQREYELNKIRHQIYKQWLALMQCICYYLLTLTQQYQSYKFNYGHEGCDSRNLLI